MGVMSERVTEFCNTCLTLALAIEWNREIMFYYEDLYYTQRDSTPGFNLSMMNKNRFVFLMEHEKNWLEAALIHRFAILFNNRGKNVACRMNHIMLDELDMEWARLWTSTNTTFPNS